MTTTLLPVTSGSTVQFRQLFFRASETVADEWIVGHEPSDTAIALPKSGVIAIQQLQAGLTVAQASEAVCLQNGEEIDVVDLIEGLSQLGLIESIDGQHTARPETIGQGWLGHIPPTAIAWLYSRPALLLFGLLIFAGPVVLLFDAAIRPRADDFLWNTSYTVDTFTLFLLGAFLLLKHELAHLFAARSRGLNAELTFGYRLFYLVAVSRAAGVWKLPRRDRLLIYSAGIGSDCLVAGVCALVLFTAHAHLLVLTPALKDLLGIIIISEYLGVAWELQIFMKTDVYHIVTDLTDQHDLPERARNLLLRLWQRLMNIFLCKDSDSLHNQDAIDREYRVDWLFIGYTVFMVFGFIGSFLLLLFYFLPATLLAIHGETQLLVVALHSGNIFHLIDGAIALATQFVCFLLLCWSWAKSYRKRHSIQKTNDL